MAYVRSVGCPLCKAKPMDFCTDTACHTVVPFHRERYAAAEKKK